MSFVMTQPDSLATPASTVVSPVADEVIVTGGSDAATEAADAPAAR
jgi:hypothetical protein